MVIRAPNVVGVFLLIYLQFVSGQHQYDLHKYMDAEDLAYHFGVSKAEKVPAYDITSPTFHRAYRDFTNYARKPNWIYPTQIEFDVNTFNRKYRVIAFRNDHLIAPQDFAVTYHGKTHGSPTMTIQPTESELHRHYLGSATSVFDDPDPDDNDDSPNSAFSLSEDGIRGLIQGRQSLYRIIPIKRRFVQRYAATFDMREDDIDMATHIVYPVSAHEITVGMNIFRAAQNALQLDEPTHPKKKKKKKKGRPRKPLTASMKLGVIVDFSVFDVMTRWGFQQEHEQVYFIISFFNEVQLMYQEPKLMRKLKLTVALQSIGFFTDPQNDLGSTPYAEQYIENVCAGPYNNHDLDHVQILSYLDIFDVGAKRLVAYTEEFELPRPFQYPWPGRPQPSQSYPEVEEGRRLYDTVGLAWIGSTCDKRKHCSIVEMNSPIASFSAAHEIGHSIGVDHEVEEGGKCPFNSKDPHSSSFMSAVSWSANSWATSGKLPVLTRCAVKEFVSAVKKVSSCLLKPEVDRTNPAVDFKLAFREIIKTPIEPNRLCQFLMGELWLNSQKWKREQIYKIYAPSTAVGDQMCHAMDCKIVGVEEPKKAFGFKFGPAIPGTICSVDGKSVCYNFKCTDRTAIPQVALW